MLISSELRSAIVYRYYPDRGLKREAAARYVGVSPTTFDKLVDLGTMPKPARVGTRRIWDRVELDHAFDELPTDEDRNLWDEVIGG